MPSSNAFFTSSCTTTISLCHSRDSSAAFSSRNTCVLGTNAVCTQSLSSPVSLSCYTSESPVTLSPSNCAEDAPRARLGPQAVSPTISSHVHSNATNGSAIVRVQLCHPTHGSEQETDGTAGEIAYTRHDTHNGTRSVQSDHHGQRGQRLLQGRTRTVIITTWSKSSKPQSMS